MQSALIGGVGRANRSLGLREQTIPEPSNVIWRPKLVGCQKMSKLHDVFSKFNTMKLSLMQEISFHGLCEMEDLSQNRVFSLWMPMQTKSDGDPMEFEYSDGSRVPMYSTHVSEILGLRAEGIKISLREDNIREETVDEVRKLLGVDELTLPNVCMVVEKDIDEGSTKQEKDAFKVATVLFVFAFFLDCRDREPRLPKYLLPYVARPDELKELDFSSCVLDCIGAAARKVKDFRTDGYSTCVVGGCSIVQQIFYLDTIDFGVNKVRQAVYPRVKYYTKPRMDFLIGLDKNMKSETVSHWYGYYKRNDQMKVEEVRGLVNGVNKRKKYRSKRQSKKQLCFSRLVKVIEDHHDEDGCVLEELRLRMERRKNLLLDDLAEHVQDEISSESEVHITSDEEDFEVNPPSRKSRLPKEPGVWQRQKKCTGGFSGRNINMSDSTNVEEVLENIKKGGTKHNLQQTTEGEHA